jgi:hypothetical protein
MRDQSIARAVHVNMVGDIAVNIVADITEFRKGSTAKRGLGVRLRLRYVHYSTTQESSVIYRDIPGLCNA